MWDGIFQADLYDQTHRTKRSSVALTVFAVGRWVGFLRLALSPGGTHDLSSPFHGAVGDFSAILFECNKHNLFLMDMHSENGLRLPLYETISIFRQLPA